MTSRSSRASRRAVVGALVLALGGLTACSSEETPSADPTPQVTESLVPSGDPTDGVEVSGDGYSLTAPSGWADNTDQVRRSYSKVDLSATDTSVTPGEGDNLNVFVSDKRRIKTQRKAERILSSELRGLGSTVKVRNIRIQEPGELDGEVAYSATARLKIGRTRIRTTQFFAKHDDAWYLLTFSYGPNTDGETEAEEIQAMVDSWSWDD